MSGWISVILLAVVAGLLAWIISGLTHLSKQLAGVDVLLRQIRDKIGTVDGLLYDMFQFHKMTPEQQANTRQWNAELAARGARRGAAEASDDREV